MTTFEKCTKDFSVTDIDSSFEKDWRKKLIASNKKAREWLFRHAIEVHTFQQECKSSQDYFKQKVEEWLGYSSDLASKWARAGGFIKAYGESFEAKNLPASMSTLIEYARMEKDELKECKDEGLVHPNVTQQEVRDFRATYKEAKAKAEAEAEAAHKAYTEKAESLLAFEYADNVPEWIIARIEDMVAEGVLEPSKTAAMTLKFAGIDEEKPTTWVLILAYGAWTATEFDDREFSEKESPKREKPAGALPDWKQHMQALGIDIVGKTIAPWALKALIKAAKQHCHPDKETGSHDAFLAVTTAEEFFNVK